MFVLEKVNIGPYYIKVCVDTDVWRAFLSSHSWWWRRWCMLECPWQELFDYIARKDYFNDFYHLSRLNGLSQRLKRRLSFLVSLKWFTARILALSSGERLQKSSDGKTLFLNLKQTRKIKFKNLNFPRSHATYSPSLNCFSTFPHEKKPKSSTKQNLKR